VKTVQIRALAVIVLASLMLARPQRAARAVPIETGCVKCFNAYCPDPVTWCAGMMPWCNGTPTCSAGNWMCPPVTGGGPLEYDLQVICGDEPM
jgi:hypothetical protein